MMLSWRRKLTSAVVVVGTAVALVTAAAPAASAGIGTWEWHEMVHQNGDKYAPLVATIQPGFRGWLCGGHELPFANPPKDYTRHHTHTAYDVMLPPNTTVSYSYNFSADEYAFSNTAQFQFELTDHTTGQLHILQSDSSTWDKATVTKSFNLSAWGGRHVHLEWQCENWGHPGGGFMGYGGYNTSVNVFNVVVP